MSTESLKVNSEKKDTVEESQEQKETQESPIKRKRESEETLDDDSESVSDSEFDSDLDSEGEEEIPIGKMSKRQKKAAAKRSAFSKKAAPVDTTKIRTGYKTNSATKKKHAAAREEQHQQKFHSRETKSLRRDAADPKRIFEKDEGLMHYVKK